MTTAETAVALETTEPTAGRARARFGIQKAEPQWLITVRIILLHLLALGIFFVEFDWRLVWLAAATCIPRMIATECVYHRYFAHRAFKTSRPFQFLLAALAVSTGQRGILWWASTHRRHHRYADAPGDVHSPQVDGFWHGHMGWTLNGRNADTDLDAIADFARFPELRALNKLHYLPGLCLLIGLYVAGEAGWFGSGIGGVQAVVWGFFFSTVVVLHATFAVNSLGHGGGAFGGTRRYATPDASVNHPLIALLTMGGGWHNNHHRYPAAARAGFAWWEIDVTYWVIKLFAALGLVWDVRPVPSGVLAEGGLGRGRSARAATRSSH